MVAETSPERGGKVPPGAAGEEHIQFLVTQKPSQPLRNRDWALVFWLIFLKLFAFLNSIAFIIPALPLCQLLLVREFLSSRLHKPDRESEKFAELMHKLCLSKKMPSVLHAKIN